MVTLLLAKRASFEGTTRRSASVAERNVAALGSAYWLVMLGGFLEPVLYLFSIGIGVGALIEDITLPGGVVVDYAEFVAPAMLAASAMSGCGMTSRCWWTRVSSIFRSPHGRSRFPTWRMPCRTSRLMRTPVAPRA